MEINDTRCCGPCLNIGLPRLPKAVENTKDLSIEYVSINVNDKGEEKMERMAKLIIHELIAK